MKAVILQADRLTEEKHSVSRAGFIVLLFGRNLTLPPLPDGRAVAERARPRAQQGGQHGAAAIFLPAWNLRGWLRPGTGALRRGQCQVAPLLFVMLLFYLSSNGPVRMMEAGGAYSGGSEFVHNFYAPWRWAYNSTPLHRPLGMYLHFWHPAGFDKDGYASHTN